MIRTYDIARTWRENLEAGPRLPGEMPSVPPTRARPMLGLRLDSRLGVAAGLLLDSRWIRAYARLGFDLLTYKTVRSSPRPSHPMPNWVFVDDGGRASGPVRRLGAPPADPAQISSSVCFGMPSMPPGYWRRDIGAAREALGPGQALAVSVAGTPDGTASLESLAGDYALCARWAAEAGADLVEANLSCPSVCTSEGSVYQDPRASRAVAQAIRAAIGARPLLLKAGVWRSPARMESFLEAVAGIADGVVMVNGVSRPVVEADGSPVFGPGAPRAGVLGRSIHRQSVEAVRQARRILGRRPPGRLHLLAVGGASTVRDIDDFFEAGADAVLAGSSPMYRPFLACEYKAARSGRREAHFLPPQEATPPDPPPGPRTPGPPSP